TSPGGVAVTDDAGRRVTLSAPARRIVSLSPAVTELLFALGAGDWVVGRTTWCDYPPAARAVPSVGDGLNPNLEAVAARRPDLVILYRSALNETAAQQLARLGIAAAVVRQDRLEDLARAAGLVATLTGRGAAGASLARGIDSLLHAPAPPAPAAARRPDEVARAGCGRRGGIRAGRRCGARACAARQSHNLGHRALPAAAACDPRVPGRRRARPLGREPSGPRAQPTRRPVPARPFGGGGPRRRAGHRAAHRGALGAAARGLRWGARRDGPRLP